MAKKRKPQPRAVQPNADLPLAHHTFVPTAKTRPPRTDWPDKYNIKHSLETMEVGALVLVHYAEFHYIRPITLRRRLQSKITSYCKTDKSGGKKFTLRNLKTALGIYRLK